MTMITTKPKRVPSRSAALRRLARKFADAVTKERFFKNRRQDIDAILKEAMADEDVTTVSAGRFGTVFYVHDIQKRVSKAAVIAFFGEEQGQKFWDQLIPDEVEYLTVKAPKSAWTR